MSGIYLATKDVTVPGYGATNYDHLYLVYDPDDNNQNGNEFILRVGPDGTVPIPSSLPGYPAYTLYTIGEFKVEIGEPINSSADSLGSDSPQSRWYSKINLDGVATENVWNFFLAHATAIDNNEFDYVLAINGTNNHITNVFQRLILRSVKGDLSESCVFLVC